MNLQFEMYELVLVHRLIAKRDPALETATSRRLVHYLSRRIILRRSGSLHVTVEEAELMVRAIEQFREDPTVIDLDEDPAATSAVMVFGNLVQYLDIEIERYYEERALARNEPST